MQALRLTFDGYSKVSLHIPNTCLWVNEFNCSVANSDSFAVVHKSVLDFIRAAKFVPWENLVGYENNAITAEEDKKNLLIAIENTTSVEELCNIVNDSTYFTLG